LAFPSTRIVTTAGATTLTMSAYESRPPAIAWVIGAVATLCDADELVAGEVAEMRQAAPVTRTIAATTATPARVSLWLTPKRVVFIGGVLSGVLSLFLIRRDTALPGRCRNITSVKGSG